MNGEQIQTLEQVNQFLGGSEALGFRGITTEEKYRWMEELLIRFKYHRLKRDEKGVIQRYIERITGYSRAQVSRLIGRYKQTWHGNISRISVAYLHNLRRSNTSRNITRRFSKTKPVVSRIGEQVKPDAQGQPGYIRIDTVHQEDLNSHKGVYHINAVDEITQWEIVASVERISEAYMVPVLESLLVQFPSGIKGFHSDNGLEFVNHIVASLQPIEQTTDPFH